MAQVRVLGAGRVLLFFFFFDLWSHSNFDGALEKAAAPAPAASGGMPVAPPDADICKICFEKPYDVRARCCVLIVVC